MSEDNRNKRTVDGRVVATARDKTATIAVERMVKHPLYGKFIRRTTRLHAHDEANSCRNGDWVSIQECRPVSRLKGWRLVQVLERAAQ